MRTYLPDVKWYLLCSSFHRIQVNNLTVILFYGVGIWLELSKEWQITLEIHARVQLFRIWWINRVLQDLLDGYGLPVNERRMNRTYWQFYTVKQEVNLFCLESITYIIYLYTHKYTCKCYIKINCLEIHNVKNSQDNTCITQYKIYVMCVTLFAENCIII